MQLALFSYAEKTWPEEIVDSLNGRMTYIDTPDGRLYCVRDWVYVVSGSTNRDRHAPLKDLKRMLKKRGDFKVGEKFTTFPNPDAGNQPMDFANDVSLYELTMRMDDKSEAVRRVKSHMAKSAAFLDWARRHPDVAAAGFAELAKQKRRKEIPFRQSRKYRALLDSGYSPEEAERWLTIRQEGKKHRSIITEVWHGRGNIGQLTDEVYLVTTGQRAREWRKELNIKVSPREYFSALTLMVINLVESIAAVVSVGRQSRTQDELIEDIHHAARYINLKQLAEDLPDLTVRNHRIRPPEQRKLLGSGR